MTSRIGWTDKTWDPVTGLGLPLHWKRPRKVFVNSMSDLFHPDVPFEFIDQVFAVMALAPQHTFQVLTTRPKRMQSYFIGYFTRHKIGVAAKRFTGKQHPQGHDCDPDVCNMDFPLKNVWLGVSVEDQATAEERLPLLLNTPAAVRWISAEPLLGRIDLCETFGMWWNQTMGCFEAYRSAGFNRNPNNEAETALDWVVVGGESGPKAQPMHPDWARSLRDQCAAAGVPFLFKHWGEWLPVGRDPSEAQPAMQQHGPSVICRSWPDGETSIRIGKKAAGRQLDGVTHDESPERQDRAENTSQAPDITGGADPLYGKAVEIVQKTQKASIPLIQGYLLIGYNRTARLLEQMEKFGVVSRMDSVGSRKVLAPRPAGSDAVFRCTKP